LSNIIKEIDGLEVPSPELSLWIAQKRSHNIVFSNEEDLLDYISDYCIKKEEFEANRDNENYDKSDSFYINLIKRLSIILPEIIRYDYLGECLGKNNVFFISYFTYEDNRLVPKNSLFKGISNNGIVTYSEDGISWSSSYGNLHDLYYLFEEYGVNFQKEKIEKNNNGRQLVKQ